MSESRSELARKRWRLLGDILVNRNLQSRDVNLSSVSVRRFTSFGLLSTELILNDCIEADLSTKGEQNDITDGSLKSVWYKYTSPFFLDFSVFIRHLDQNICFSDLFGFNNTGNVCVWPSEEVLTYYCLQHSELFRNKFVCELGGGMTCLAGVAVSAFCKPNYVLLTDGNLQSVNNVDYIVERNRKKFKSSRVEARLLQWDEVSMLHSIESHFDLIISADCLFFDECRQSLLDTIFHLLKPDGEAIIFAPSRGETFDEFVKIAAEKLTITENTRMYDEHMWNLHLKNLSKGVGTYDENLHYPRLLKLKRKNLLDGAS